MVEIRFPLFLPMFLPLSINLSISLFLFRSLISIINQPTPQHSTMSATGVSSAASPTSASSATGGHIPLPHTVSYAKSSRSQCKGCHKVIEARQLRMGVTSLSPFFDGTVVKYYHVPCYFKRKRTAGVDTSKLDGFKGIQYADQDNLRKLFGEPTGTAHTPHAHTYSRTRSMR